MVSLFSPKAIKTAVAHSFFPRRGIAVVLLAGSFATAAVYAQQAPNAAPTAATDQAAPAPPASSDQTPTAVMSNTAPKRGRTRKTAEDKKDEKVVQSKDTVKNEKARKAQMKINPLGNVKSNQPDKQLYDKALVAINKGRFEVARLDLQTLLSTYPDSEYQMRAKLAFADSWYREGGTAALAQAETEYHDFIIFFPNAPEAAEAQMRIGDIYFKQMDRPDRDYAKAVHAQEEYRTMLTQYPDSSLIPEAKQHLREVQEVMAQRESSIGEFYGTHENWSAAIARYQTVVDTYPLYSHIDQTLIGLGDAYASMSRYIRTLKLPEDARGRLLKNYDDQAIAAYSRVVTQYAASAHVEDARDRLEAMNVPIPEPTAEQLAASQALEDSRQTYNLANRAKGLLFRGPDTVQSARIGDPSMADPKATLAPEVSHRSEQAFKVAMDPKAGATPAAGTAATTSDATEANAAAGNTPAAAGAPMNLQDIPAVDAAPATAVTGSSFTATPTGVAPVSSGGGTGVGVTILSPGATTSSPSAPPPAGSVPANYGLKAAGPANTGDLPPVEKAAEAPDAVNDVAGQKTPEGAQPVLDKNGKVKKVKPEFDKGEESSSTHKKKKGLKKVNPF
ncbi:Beta-barrel assembly machine subunit BamD [Terriglobus roseus]|uniref:Beta-barrel assembly machine subunit BamD n=2 Tax=Terriglobus roseus TaxID=392734 RepID=A0A1H4S304_9BACT|nr:Beta-barrel assembly machine subunit BamD [Terriglobus roseus]